jgi:hypothetical protein
MPTGKWHGSGGDRSSSRGVYTSVCSCGCTVVQATLCRVDDMCRVEQRSILPGWDHLFCCA